MASIYDWSKTAGDNDTSDSAINWQENQIPSTVNNSARQMMGREAEFRDDISGALVSTNTSNAYSVTANSAFTTLADGRVLAFRANANNSGAATLNVNSIGSKAIRYNSASGDAALAANMIRSGGVYVVRYSTVADGGTGAWILQSPSLGTTAFVDFTPVQQGGGTGQNTDKIYIGGSSDGPKIMVGSTDYGTVTFPSGTRLVFHQASAPPGWTQDTSKSDYALRTVSGSGGGAGGTLAFSTVFGRTATDAHTLTISQIPLHYHAAGMYDPGHTHSYAPGVFNSSGAGTYWGALSASGSNATYIYSSNVGGNVTGVRVISGNGLDTTGSTGGDGSHTHNIDLRVAYLDMILCQKD